ncbi:MAG TPA: hypothetical protein VIT41_17860 [Microlunatus sp.]
MSVRRWWVLAAGSAAAACLVGCGAEPAPADPTPSAAPTTATSPAPTTALPPTPSLTASPTGLTLRQLGFVNGPLDEFSLPDDLVIATRVDQPNVVTIVLAGPNPQTVEDHLRATLPENGFTIDARADAGEAMTFRGHGWTGGFTGSGATSAIVLRPA